MLQSLSKDIRECYLQAEQCGRWAEVAPSQPVKMHFLDMERRWLSLAHNYEFAQRLSSFIEPFRRRNGRKNKPLKLAAGSLSGNAR
jgi:hypothetical protein